MSFVVTVGSDVQCPDQGKVTMSSSAKLTVSTKKVVARTDLVGAQISGCKQQPPPQTNVACLAVTTITSGEAGKLTVKSKPVLLDSLVGQTLGVPKNTISCKDAKQKKLTAK